MSKPSHHTTLHAPWVVPARGIGRRLRGPHGQSVHGHVSIKASKPHRIPTWRVYFWHWAAACLWSVFSGVGLLRPAVRLVPPVEPHRGGRPATSLFSLEKPRGW